MLIENFESAEREEKLLRFGEIHRHLLHCYATEKCNNYAYIALQKCEATLEDFITKKYQNPLVNEMEVVREALLGLDHLHSLVPAIVHRDIKPSNILIGFPNKNDTPTGILSDLGLSKQLELYRESFSVSTTRGSSGWMAPELMNEIQNSDDTKMIRTTLKVDIFTSGVLIYYAKTFGKHPFGDKLFLRDGNILQNKYKLEDLDRSKDSILLNLIQNMIRYDPKKRPSIKAVLNHPAFWYKRRIQDFFLKVSDFSMKKDGKMLHTMLEHGFNNVVASSNWISDLDPIIGDKLKSNKKCKYDGTKIKSLLRAIRNYAHHYHEITEAERAALGSLEDEFITYWLDRFPNLLLHVFKSLMPWKSVPELKGFYGDEHFDFP